MALNFLMRNRLFAAPWSAPTCWRFSINFQTGIPKRQLVGALQGGVLESWPQ